MDLSFAVPVVFILNILALHTFADFFLQTRWMANNKSSSHRALFYHVGLYGACFVIPFGWKYALVNAVLHYITDFITSRGTKYCWKMKETQSPKETGLWMYFFFGIIGIDQAIHLACLILTYGLIT